VSDVGADRGEERVEGCGAGRLIIHHIFWDRGSESSIKGGERKVVGIQAIPQDKLYSWLRPMVLSVLASLVPEDRASPGGTSGCDREPTGYSTARGGQATHWSCCLSEPLEC
jgi:hypothetical protein